MRARARCRRDAAASACCVATDGEVAAMRHAAASIRIRPRALRVIVPGAERRPRCAPSSICPTCTSAASTPALLEPLRRQLEASRPTWSWSRATSRSARAPRSSARRARFLDTLPAPQLVVPGNHDVPLYNVVERFLAPLRQLPPASRRRPGARVHRRRDRGGRREHRALAHLQGRPHQRGAGGARARASSATCPST